MKRFALFVAIVTGAFIAYKITDVTTSDESSDGVNRIPENGGTNFLPDYPEVNQQVDDVIKVIKETGGIVLQSSKEIVLNTVAAVSNIFGTKYDSLIEKSATENGLSPNVLYKLLYTESHFRPDIITGKTRSATGALGIAQFMPATAVEWCGSVEAALNPEIAIPASARYLSWLIKKLGSVDAGVAAYNWGIGNVQKKGLANAPKETVDYVAGITGTNLKA